MRAQLTHIMDLSQRGVPTPRAPIVEKDLHTGFMWPLEEHLVIFDTETTPFDDKIHPLIIPFCAVLYAKFLPEPLVVWDNNYADFKLKVMEAFDSLDRRCIIYAHHGGGFDYMFLIDQLHGPISYKGSTIMSAITGTMKHELRDSYHIIPAALKSYKKDDFDYTMLSEKKRDKHKAEIIQYCLNDCKYLYDLVYDFLDKNGYKVSIGQAAMADLSKIYKFARLTEEQDARLRPYFFGGRVECLAGPGIFKGPFKLYDVNSMYPYVMAKYQHPIGGDYMIREGKPNANTCFVELDAHVNIGALVGRTLGQETSSESTSGSFVTTIHEYNMALKLDLIRGVKVTKCIDCDYKSDFSKFIVPLYDKRQETKRLLHTLDKGSPEYDAVFRDDLIIKLKMNNAYGKFAQNPRKFCEYYLTAYGVKPPESWLAGKPDIHLPFQESEEMNFALWTRPIKNRRYFNVGTAASITGAARAVLLHGLYNADTPIYCDTDSIICRNLSNVTIDAVALGAWDIEETFSNVAIAGKKAYGAIRDNGSIKTRWKGQDDVTYNEICDTIAGKEFVRTRGKPTFHKTGEQEYLTRTMRSTSKHSTPLFNFLEGKGKCHFPDTVLI